MKSCLIGWLSIHQFIYLYHYYISPLKIQQWSARRIDDAPFQLLCWCNRSRPQSSSMHNSAVDLIAVLIAWRPERADGWPLLQPESRWRLTSRTENRSSLPTPQAPACCCSTGALCDSGDSPPRSATCTVPAFTGPEQLHSVAFDSKVKGIVRRAMMFETQGREEDPPSERLWTA